MPPGPAALVKPVPCCVPRLQPCCPAKEVISQQHQVTLSFFFFFFLFSIFFFSFPFPPSPPSSVFSAPRTPGSSEQAANLSAQHNTSPPGGKEDKKKKKENQTLRTARRRVPFRLRCPPVPAAPPRQPCGERLGLPAWDEMAEAGSTAIRARRGAVLGLAGWLLVFYFLF